MANQIYYAVYIDNEIKFDTCKDNQLISPKQIDTQLNSPFKSNSVHLEQLLQQLPSSNDRIFECQIDAFKFAKQYKLLNARTKSFTSKSDALIYANNGSNAAFNDQQLSTTLMVSTPPFATPKRPLLRPSPNCSPAQKQKEASGIREHCLGDDAPSAGWAKVSATDMNRLLDAIKKNDLQSFNERVLTNPKYLIGDNEYIPSIVHAGARKNALHVAAEYGSLDIICCILSLITDVEYKFIKRMFNDWQSLTEEAKQNHRSLLIRHYLNNIEPKTMRTPLWYAVDKAFPDCLAELLAAGADPNIVDKKKLTPLEHGKAKLSCFSSDDHRQMRERLLKCISLLGGDLKNPQIFHRYYIPIYRPIDYTGAPIVGEIMIEKPDPFSTYSLFSIQPFKAQRLPYYRHSDPSMSYQLSAYIGPVNIKNDADEIYAALTARRGRMHSDAYNVVGSITSKNDECSTPLRNFISNLTHDNAAKWSNIKCSDASKGVERVARYLAAEYEVALNEKWRALDNQWFDFSQPDLLLSAINNKLRHVNIISSESVVYDPDVRRLVFDDDDDDESVSSNDNTDVEAQDYPDIFYEISDEMNLKSEMTVLAEKLSELHMNDSIQDINALEDEKFFTAPSSPNSTKSIFCFIMNTSTPTQEDKDLYRAILVYHPDRIDASLTYLQQWYDRMRTEI